MGLRYHRSAIGDPTGTMGRVRAVRPIGVVTRGTTHPHRLRRCDRWLAGPQGWRLRQYAGAAPVVVDLGFGASPVTAVELLERLRPVRSDVTVVGIEIDPERVRVAQELTAPGLTFAVGGFEVPLAGGAKPVIVRAFNVLRQYPEADVAAAWAQLRSRIAPDGLIVDGTCDELGRLSTWVALDATGPVSLTLSWRLAGLDRPSAIAERLPKALIHRNVPGERIHDLMTSLDRVWALSSSHSSYGVRQRFIAAASALREAGWPLLDGPRRWRLGELTVAWDAVAPAQGDTGSAMTAQR